MNYSGVTPHFWGEILEAKTELRQKNWDEAPVSIEKISDLVFKRGFYPRKQVDQATVDNYARALESGAIFPPIKVGLYQGKKIVVDGFHRVAARQRFLKDTVNAAILPFDSEAELFAEAIRLNSTHGKAFTEAELKANIKRLQQYKFSIKEVTALLHFPTNEIRKEFKKPIVAITGPSGRRISFFRDLKTVEPDQNDKIKVIQLRDSLKLCNRWAESGRIPINAEMMALVIRLHLALGKVLSEDPQFLDIKEIKLNSYQV